MELFTLLGSIVINKTAAEKSLDELVRKTGKTRQEIEDAVNKIGNVAFGIGKAVIAVGSVLGGAWVAAIEGSREYRTEMGKLDTAFVTNGHSSEAATKTYQALQSVLGDSAVSVEAANHLAALTDNEKDLQTWTDICTGVFATFGDSLPIEGLTEAANETAKTGIVTGSLADALNWAGTSEDKFNKQLEECSNEQERQKLIMDTLNGTYKDASVQYQETNKDIIAANKAQEKLTNAFSEFGRVGEPILTAIKNKVAEMVSAAVPHLENFIGKIKDAKKWVQDNKKTIDNWKAAIVGATAGVASFVLILKWGSIMSAAKTAILGVRGAVLLLNAAMKANLIGLIVSLVIGLVAAFVTLWKNNEGFRNFWLSMWAKIKSACGSAVSWIKGKFNDLKSALGVVKSTFGNIQKTITDKLDAARDKVRSVIDKIKGYFNTTLKFKGLKMPSIKLTMQKGSGLMAKAAELLGLSGVPKFSVKWNAAGGILTKPTIFGMTGNTLLGGGEAGHEAIAPIDTLQKYIRDAVSINDEGIRRTLIEQFQLLMDFLGRNMPHDIRMDSGALVGEMVPAIDMRLSDRLSHTKRGNTR